VSAVNYNSPGQVVIAGTKAAVERAMLLCKEAGAKRALPLPVSVPSHCALMRPAAEQLSARLAEIQLVMPEIAVIQNVTADVSSGVVQLSENLVAQLFSPVQWTSTVNRMAAMGVDTLIECGPGKVLSGLNKRIQRSLNASAINDVASFEKALNG
jgi:[acyl-carrier-protein] S-malonyltransferase